LEPSPPPKTTRAASTDALVARVPRFLVAAATADVFTDVGIEIIGVELASDKGVPPKFSS
jgi:hypothetical protein